jgi:hypothetical protein
MGMLKRRLRMYFDDKDIAKPTVVKQYREYNPKWSATVALRRNERTLGQEDMSVALRR